MTSNGKATAAVDDRLLSPQQLAELCGVPLGTVYQWNTRRVGPRSIRVGKHVRYRRRDVDAWLDANAVGGGAA